MQEHKLLFIGTEYHDERETLLFEGVYSGKHYRMSIQDIVDHMHYFIKRLNNIDAFQVGCKVASCVEKHIDAAIDNSSKKRMIPYRFLN